MPACSTEDAAIEAGMVAAANLVEVAALVGDTARATILAALMDGRSLTATELAFAAGISKSTASGHLGKLVNAQLLAVTRKRRFSYYRIASPLVATMMESMKCVAAIDMPPRHHSASTRSDPTLFARTCYDHLAGTVGVALSDALIAKNYVVLTEDGGEVTPAGEKFLRQFGADVTPPAGSRRIYCKPCLDWSERRYHIKGLVGAALLQRMFDLGWFVSIKHSRALRLTADGKKGMAAYFGLNF